MKFEEDIEHILTVCLAYSDVRSRILAEMKNVCENSQSGINLDDLKQNAKLLTQFVLDCCSLNLPRRFNVNDHDCHKIFQLSRDLCYFIRKTRTDCFQSNNLQDVLDNMIFDEYPVIIMVG